MTPLTAHPAAGASAPPPRPRQYGPDNPAAVLCHYAGDPARRPRCTLTAEVRLGPVALCGPCARARSTLGKGTAPVPLPPGPQIDVLNWVTDTAAGAARARRILDAAVTRARSQGRSWTQIAGRLGITRQAAQQRFGHHPSPAAPPATASQRTTP